MPFKPLSAPFPWFGGKARVATAVWERFGPIKNYVEPFFGSGAVLLGKPPTIACTETVNDLDALVCNFWRAVQQDPEGVAHWADAPVNENDLHARHLWLVDQLFTLQPRIEGDPAFYDVQIAGWWVWGICLWIGSGWCSGRGPWQRQDIEGVPYLVHRGDAEQGVCRKRVHLGNAGRGINRQLVHLGNAGQGILAWMRALQDRLRFVRVCSGQWDRVCGPSVTYKHGLTGVFLDPPYGTEADRCDDLYRIDCTSIANDVRAWCLAQGHNPLLRIVLCGYAAEHQDLEDAGWSVFAWKTRGGYALQGADRTNSTQERIWFSPHCLQQRQLMFFA